MSLWIINYYDCHYFLFYSYSPTVSPERDYDTALPIPAPRKKLPPLTPDVSVSVLF